MSEKRDLNDILSRLADQFLLRNYDCLYLRAMLDKCASAPEGSTLIVGSSHALNGIQESAWHYAVNCSMHSQDIYYDYVCARRALLSAGKGRFEKCFIVMGYYIAYQDLSRSTVSRETVISNIYYPIFRDARHWASPTGRDPWDGFGDIPEPIKTACEQAAVQKIRECGTYYTSIRPRGTYFDLKGRAWAQVSPGERRSMGQVRAESHNKSYRHKESFEENKGVFQEFIRFLYEHDVMPIVVVTPFTPEYNRYILPEMKAAVPALLDYVAEDVHFVDFNQGDLFTPEDFMDTDHLSAQGAEKVSKILVELFGQ